MTILVIYSTSPNNIDHKWHALFVYIYIYSFNMFSALINDNSILLEVSHVYGNIAELSCRYNNLDLVIMWHLMGPLSGFEVLDFILLALILSKKILYATERPHWFWREISCPRPQHRQQLQGELLVALLGSIWLVVLCVAVQSEWNCWVS